MDGINENISLKYPTGEERPNGDDVYTFVEYNYDKILDCLGVTINDLIDKYKKFKECNSSDPRKEEKLKQLERIVELLLPESYLQKRTITMNYTVFRHIYYDRYYKPHKMLEWRQFCEQILDNLSYVEFIDEKIMLANERNELLSKLGELNIEKSYYEREVKKLNEKLMEGAEG